MFDLERKIQNSIPVLSVILTLFLFFTLPSIEYMSQPMAAGMLHPHTCCRSPLLQRLRNLISHTPHCGRNRGRLGGQAGQMVVLCWCPVLTIHPSCTMKLLWPPMTYKLPHTGPTCEFGGLLEFGTTQFYGLNFKLSDFWMMGGGFHFLKAPYQLG